MDQCSQIIKMTSQLASLRPLDSTTPIAPEALRCTNSVLKTISRHYYTGRVLETVFVTADEKSFVKNFIPVVPPGM